MIENPNNIREQLEDRRILRIDVGRHLVMIAIEGGILSIGWDGEKQRVIVCTGKDYLMNSITHLGENT